MDPISATANIAGVIGLVDFICRSGKALYAFLSAVKDAPREIAALQEELSSIENILLIIRDYCSEKSQLFSSDQDAEPILSGEVATTLQALQFEYSKLWNAAGDTWDYQSGKPGRQLRVLRKRLRWVFDEKKVSRSCQRLERLKMSLSICFSALGRQNDVFLRKAVDTLHEDSINLSSRADSVCSSLSRLESLATKADCRLEALQTSVTVASKENSKALRDLHRAIGERGVSRQLTLDSDKHIHEKLDYLISSFKEIRVDDISDSSYKQDGWARYNDELGHLTLPLMLMKSKFVEAISELMTPFRDFGVLSTEDANILQEEFDELLALSHDSSAKLVRRKKARGKEIHSSEPSMSGIQPDNQRQNPVFTSQYDNKNMVFGHRGNHPRTSRRWRELQKVTLIGILSVRVEWGRVHTESQLSRVQVMFTPSLELTTKGVLASIATATDTSKYLNISRHISSYAVIDHKSPIFDFIASNNLEGVRELLRSRAVSPTDRNPDNESVLSFAARRLRTEICQLLLNEGADPVNCGVDGSSAIYSIRNGLWYRQSNCHVSKEDIDHIVRAFITAGCDLDEAAFDDSLLHNTSVYWGQHLELIGESDIATFIHLLLQLGADIECRNQYGATPLLYDTCMHGLPGLIVLRELLRHGANPHAVTYYLEGALHMALAFATFSPGHDDPYLHERLLLLLRAGCDPSQLDYRGHSPCDFALHNPAVWLRWCIAIELSNVTTMDDILQAESKELQTKPSPVGKDSDSDSASEWESCDSQSDEGKDEDDNNNKDQEPPTEDDSAWCLDHSHIFISFQGNFPWSCHPLCHECGLRCVPGDIIRRKHIAWELHKLAREQNPVEVTPLV